MSLPRELLDELLSRYMDGELSADELARVEQLLTTDAEVRATLDALRASSSLVRRAVESSGKPGADFAARVFAAAAVEAESNGLAVNHPLRLAAADAARKNVSERGRSRGVAYAGLLALAASLMFAVFFATRDGGNNQLAVESGVTQEGAAVEVPSTQPADDNGQADDLSQTLAAEATELHPKSETKAEPGLDKPSAMLADNGPEPGRPASDIAMVDDVRATGSEVAEQNAGDLSPLESGSVVAADNTSKLEKLPPGMGKLQAVMVYEVTLTAQGRENNVVARMLKNAGVRVGDERKVDGDLVGHLRDSGLVGGPANELVDEEEGDGKRCQVIFLEGSGLALERAMMGLLAAEGEVSKVGFNLMMNPPVVAVLDELKVGDPRQVRAGDAEQETAVAHSLSPSGYDGPTDAGFAIGSQRFMALNPQQSGALSQLSAFGNGQKNDFKSQVLVVVRFE